MLEKKNRWVIMIYGWGRTRLRERGRFGQQRETQTNETEKQEGKQSKLVDTEEKRQETCSAQYPFLTTRLRKSHFKRTAKNMGPDKSDKDAIASRSKCWREGGDRRRKRKGINHKKSILKEAGVLFFIIFILEHVQLVSLSGEEDSLGY